MRRFPPLFLLVLLIGAMPMHSAGPGDPTTVRAIGASAFSITAGLSGDLFAITVTGSGSTTQWEIRVVPVHGAPYGLGPGGGGIEVDNAGDVIWATSAGSPTLERVSPIDGSRRLITNLGGYGQDVTLDDAGNIWVKKYNSGGRNYYGYHSIDQFSPAGIRLNGYRWYSPPAGPAPPVIGRMAFSAEGELHVIANGALAVVDETAEDSLRVVFESSSDLADFAFDSIGNIYLNTSTGIIRLEPDYQVLDDPFATENLGDARGIAFMRDSCGRMTRRLVAVSGSNLVEVDTTAIPAPGLRIGPEPVVAAFDDAAVVTQLLEGSVLNRRQQCRLDETGNNNGRIDIGDVSVWLERVR